MGAVEEVGAGSFLSLHRGSGNEFGEGGSNGFPTESEAVGGDADEVDVDSFLERLDFRGVMGEVDSDALLLGVFGVEDGLEALDVDVFFP